MIDCLSNPSWINPQIDCLLYLQNLRMGTLEYLDRFFLSITVFGEFWLPTLICAITYWCIDFRAGIYLFTLQGINVLITHFFKMLACVYRPWILSSAMHPSELAVPFATGYSFPSGHSAMSSSVIGGVAFLVRKNKFLCISLIGLVLLVGFSRLWLGVHTPQDVVCGLLTGLILIFVLDCLINWAEEDKNRYLYIMGIVNFLAVLAIIYILFFNTYRIDYIDGKLLVNPQKSIYNTIVAYGYALGVMNGVCLCRRFFPFNPKEVSIKRRILRGVVGTICNIVLLKIIFEYIIMNSIGLKAALLYTFVLGLFVTLLYPIIFISFGKITKSAQ